MPGELSLSDPSVGSRGLEEVGQPLKGPPAVQLGGGHGDAECDAEHNGISRDPVNRGDGCTALRSSAVVQRPPMADA